LLVQITDWSALKRADVRFATKHCVNQQRLRKGIFEIPTEGCRAALKALLDIPIEHQRFEPERMRHRADRQSTVGKLKELQDGEIGRVRH